MEKQWKLIHKIIRRMADIVTIILVLFCILFATRGL